MNLLEEEKLELVEEQQAVHYWARKYEPLELTSADFKENVHSIVKQLPCKSAKPPKYGVRHKWRTKFGAVDLLDEKTGRKFKVNGQRVKQYWGESLARIKLTTTLKDS